MCPSTLYVDTVDKIPIFQFPPYSWGIINYCTTNKWYDMWWYFSIKIGCTLKIHKTFCLSFSPWIYLTYYYILYIKSLNNIISISICRVLFCIIMLSNLLIWKNITAIIINIYFSVSILYIYVIKSCTIMYKVKKYWFV